MFKYLILLLLLVPMVFASNNSLVDLMGENQHFETRPKISTECREQYEQFMSYQPEDLVKEYCNTVNMRVVLLLGIAFLMWLLEPFVKRKALNSEYNWLMNYYKWLGLGLLFMDGYAIFIMG